MTDRFPSLLERLQGLLSRSIRRQMAWSFSLAALLLISVGSYAIYVYQRNFLYEQHTAETIALAETLAHSSASWVLSDDINGLQETLEGALHSSDLVWVVVQDMNGEILASTRPEYRGRMFEDAISLRLREAQPVHQVLVAGSALVDVAAPVHTSRRHIGWVRIERTRNLVNHDLNMMLAAQTLIATLFMLAMFFMATWLARKMTGRLERLARVADQSQIGKPYVREELARADEIGTLARHLYQVLDQNVRGIKEKSESELRLRTILDSVDAFIYLKDLQGNYQFANRPVRELWHADMDEIVGYGDEKFFDARSAGDIRDNDRLVLEQGQIIRKEERNTVPRTGETFYYQSTKLPLYDERGAIYALCGISVDITERKLFEQRLAESEALLREVQTIAGLGSYVLDIQTGIWRSSDVLDQLFGISAAYARTVESWGQLIHPDDRKTMEEYLTLEVVAKGRPFDKEYRIIRHDDQAVRWVHGWGKLELDAQGKPLLMRGAIQDITERKRVEQELTEHRDHLEEMVAQKTEELVKRESTWRLAIEGSGDGVWDWNVKTNEVKYSKRWKSMLGYAEDEFEDSIAAWAKAVLEEDILAVMNALQPFLDGQVDNYLCEFRMRCKDGSVKWILGRAMITERNEFGRALRVVGTHTDITEIKRIEQAAIEASRAKSEFLANMSHEIRTPMNGVIGMVDVLLNTHLEERQRKMVQVIRESAYNQLDILNEILDFSKIEAGKLELSNEPFSVAEMVEQSCAVLHGQALQKGVDLSCALDPKVPELLQGDVLRLRQIITNLISNAIKFSSGLGRRGEVKLHASVARSDAQGVQLEISVHDNGIGMSQETLTRLFNAFTQADSATTKRFGGTGLGLVISRQLSEMMGGEIRVQSRPDEGSTFVLSVPCALATSRPPEPSSVIIPPHLPVSLLGGGSETKPTAKLLVAEDNETNQEVILQQLELLGLRADIAANGRAAFERWMSRSYPILLTDLHMPYLDGYQLTQAIREEEARRGTGQRTVIIALTANVMKGEAERCKAAGMDDYLSKPVAMTAFAEMLEKWGAYDDIQEVPQPESAQATAAPVVAEVKLIDWDSRALGHLIGDNEAMRSRLLHRFIANTQLQLIGLQKEIDAHDAGQIASIAHAVKSAARTVGAMRLGELCQEMEMAAKAGDVKRCITLGVQIDPIFEAVTRMIRQDIGPPPQ